MHSLLEQARAEAIELANLLARAKQRVVFAESCTAGMVAALLGGCPGISNWLCGSAVTYRQHTKTEWLAVSSETLADHSAESAAATKEMVNGVLNQTMEADWAAAVTGHLGPNAPGEIDGKIFISIAHRASAGVKISSFEFRLREVGRVNRQIEAAALVLSHTRQAMAKLTNS